MIKLIIVLSSLEGGLINLKDMILSDNLKNIISSDKLFSLLINSTDDIFYFYTMEGDCN